MNNRPPFAKWLEGKYLEWQFSGGSRRTQTEFAEWLGISQPLVNRYMNGNGVPTAINVDRIAARLGLEVYDLLGLARPDPDLQYIIANWDKLTPQDQADMLELIHKLAAPASPKTKTNTNTGPLAS